MNKLAFHWDDAEALQSSALTQKKLLKQWTHTAKAFGIYNLIIIGDVDNIPKILDLELSIEYFNTEDNLREAYPDGQYILLTESGEDIETFTMPAGDSIFLLGSNYEDPIEMDKDYKIGITANIPLWDVVAAGIVLHKVK